MPLSLELRLIAYAVAALAYVGAYFVGHHKGIELERDREAIASEQAKKEWSDKVAAAEKKVDAISTKYQQDTENARTELENAQKTIIAQAYASGARCPASVAPRVRESAVRQSVQPTSVPVASGQPAKPDSGPSSGDNPGLSAGAITEEVATCSALRAEVIAWRNWYPEQRDAWNDLVIGMTKK